MSYPQSAIEKNTNYGMKRGASVVSNKETNDDKKKSKIEEGGDVIAQGMAFVAPVTRSEVLRGPDREKWAESSKLEKE